MLCQEQAKWTRRLSAGWVGVEKPMAAAGMKRPCVERFDFGLDSRSAKPWVLAGPLDTRHIVMTSGVQIRAYSLYRASCGY